MICNICMLITFFPSFSCTFCSRFSVAWHFGAEALPKRLASDLELSRVKMNPTNRMAVKVVENDMYFLMHYDMYPYYHTIPYLDFWDSGLILQLYFSFVYLVFDILWHFVWSQRNSSQAAESLRNTKDALAMHWYVFPSCCNDVQVICSFHQFFASRRLSSLAVWQHPRAKGPVQLQERQS